MRRNVGNTRVGNTKAQSHGSSHINYFSIINLKDRGKTSFNDGVLEDTNS